MKNTILLTTTALLIMATRPTLSATKCVKLSSSTTYNPSSASIYNKTNWSGTCGETAVKGVAICGSTEGNLADVSDDIEISSSDFSANTECWCKMVSPAVSKWVHGAARQTTQQCMHDCVNNCQIIVGNPTVRAAMFSNLTD